MSYINHMVGESRIFDFVYDPTYNVAGESKQIKKQMEAFILERETPKSDYMFTNGCQNKDDFLNKCCFEMKSKNFDRISGGDSKIKNKFKRSRGHRSWNRHAPKCTSIIDLAFLSGTKKFSMPIIEPLIKTKGTQSIYRESTAQTDNYEPCIANSKEEVEHLEIYKLRNLLSGINYPDNLEVEAVARARQRRIFEKFLTDNYKSIDLEQQHVFIESIEWEEWIAREQQIFECQQLRMLIVSRLFKDREMSFRTKSDDVIRKNMLYLNRERLRLKTKNQAEYGRKLRQLKKNHDDIIRYKKQAPCAEHAEHSSDLYGPQMRFGKNPNRRSFIGHIQKFQDRIDKLEESVQIDPIASLKNPQTWLNFISKPKKQIKNINKNLSSDTYLNIIYEDIKYLNEAKIARSRKVKPKCLKKRNVIENTILKLQEKEKPKLGVCDIYRNPMKKLNYGTQEDAGHNAEIIKEEIIEIDPTILKENMTYYKNTEGVDRMNNMLRSTLIEFQDTRVGFMLNLLGQELARLEQQKKIQALCMLAQKERYHREAREAGLRQRENTRRFEQEILYENTFEMQNDSISCYLENILIEESDIMGDANARLKIIDMAKRIDEKTININQNPEYLTQLLRTYLYPETYKSISKLDEKHYAKSFENEIDGIINDIFNTKSKHEDDADLIDTVFSGVMHNVIPSEEQISETSSEENSGAYEAKMVIKKLLTKIVAKPKYMTVTERIVDDIVDDLIENNVFRAMCRHKKNVLALIACLEDLGNRNKLRFHSSSKGNRFLPSVSPHMKLSRGKSFQGNLDSSTDTIMETKDSIYDIISESTDTTINWCPNNDDSSSNDSTLTIMSPASINYSSSTSDSFSETTLGDLDDRLRHFRLHENMSLFVNRSLALVTSMKHLKSEILISDEINQKELLHKLEEIEVFNRMSKIKPMHSHYDLNEALHNKHKHSSIAKGEEKQHDNENEKEIFTNVKHFSMASLPSKIITNKTTNISDTLLNREKKMSVTCSLPNLNEAGNIEERELIENIKYKFQTRPTMTDHLYSMDYDNYSQNNKQTELQTNSAQSFTLHSAKSFNYLYGEEGESATEPLPISENTTDENQEYYETFLSNDPFPSKDMQKSISKQLGSTHITKPKKAEKVKIITSPEISVENSVHPTDNLEAIAQQENTVNSKGSEPTENLAALTAQENIESNADSDSSYN